MRALLRIGENDALFNRLHQLFYIMIVQELTRTFGWELTVVGWVLATDLSVCGVDGT